MDYAPFLHFIYKTNKEELEMVEGTVKFFNEQKEFGFIKADEGDVFLHISKINGDTIPKENDIVDFDIVEGDRGLQAHNVTVR